MARMPGVRTTDRKLPSPDRTILRAMTGSPCRMGSRTTEPTIDWRAAPPNRLPAASAAFFAAPAAPVGWTWGPAPSVMKAALRLAAGQSCQVMSAAVRRAPTARSCWATSTFTLGAPATAAAGAASVTASGFLGAKAPRTTNASAMAAIAAITRMNRRTALMNSDGPVEG